MKEYTLTIKTKYWGHKLTNKNPRALRKIYFWYILRGSEMYNVVHKAGMYAVRRDEVVAMSYAYQDIVEIPPVVELPIEEIEKKKSLLESLKRYCQKQRVKE